MLHYTVDEVQKKKIISVCYILPKPYGIEKELFWPP